MADIFNTLMTFGQGLMHLVFPRVCWLCRRMQPLEERPICGQCVQLMTSDARPACVRCAATVGPFLDTTRGCISCRQERFHFDQTFRLGPYSNDDLRKAALFMKQNEGVAEALAEFWAGELAARLRPLAADVVVPVPLHWLKHYQRGFNQSEVLAQSLAARLGVPCQPGWLRRVRYTWQQKALQGENRLKNVKGAFVARPGSDLQGKTVLLVDDIVTTGATASEAARALRKLKPKRIVLTVVAHADAGVV